MPEEAVIADIVDIKLSSKYNLFCCSVWRFKTRVWPALASDICACCANTPSVGCKHIKSLLLHKRKTCFSQSSSVRVGCSDVFWYVPCRHVDYCKGQVCGEEGKPLWPFEWHLKRKTKDLGFWESTNQNGAKVQRTWRVDRRWHDVREMFPFFPSQAVALVQYYLLQPHSFQDEVVFVLPQLCSPLVLHSLASALEYCGLSLPQWIAKAEILLTHYLTERIRTSFVARGGLISLGWMENYRWHIVQAGWRTFWENKCGSYGDMCSLDLAGAGSTTSLNHSRRVTSRALLCGEFFHQPLLFAEPSTCQLSDKCTTFLEFLRPG